MCCFDVYLSNVRKYIVKIESKSDTLVEYFQGVFPQSSVWCTEHLSNAWMYMDAWQCVIPWWEINLSRIIFCPTCARGLSGWNFKPFSVWLHTNHVFLLSSVINCYFDCKCALNCNHKYLPSLLRGERRVLLKKLSRGQLIAYQPPVRHQIYCPSIKFFAEENF